MMGMFLGIYNSDVSGKMESDNQYLRSWLKLSALTCSIRYIYQGYDGSVEPPVGW